MSNQQQQARRNVVEFPETDEAEKKALLQVPLDRMLGPSTLGQALEWARILCVSSLVPEGMRGNPADVLVAILWGNELGLSVIQSLQNIAVINGRASIWGDIYFAIVLTKAKDELEKFEETWDPQKDGGTWTTTVKRKGFPEVVRTFSKVDAEAITYYAQGNKKRLSEKDTYQNYPRRMYKFKARNEALRDTFPDKLMGLAIREEVDEYEEKSVGAGTTAAAGAAVSAQPSVEQLLAEYQEDEANAIGRGFDELHLSPAERRVALHKYRGKSAELLAWLKEEYTLRRTRGAQKEPTKRRQAVEAPVVAETPAPVVDDDKLTADRDDVAGTVAAVAEAIKEHQAKAGVAADDAPPAPASEKLAGIIF